MIPPVLHKILHEKYVIAKAFPISKEDEDKSYGERPGSFIPGYIGRFGGSSPDTGPGTDGMPPSPESKPPSGDSGDDGLGAKPKKPDAGGPRTGRRYRPGEDGRSYISPPKGAGTPSGRNVQLSPYFDLGGEEPSYPAPSRGKGPLNFSKEYPHDLNYFEDLKKQFNPVSTETSVVPETPSLGQRLKYMNPWASGVGRFSVGLGAGWYPGAITYGATREVLDPYIGDLPSHYAGALTSTAAAIPAAELAVSGIPAATSAVAAGEGVMGGLGALTTATRVGTVGAMANPYTWLIALGLATAPVVYADEMELANRRAQILKNFEDQEALEAKKKKAYSKLGINKDEDGWWETWKKAFAKSAMLQDVQGWSAAGRM